MKGILILFILNFIEILCGHFFCFDGDKYMICQYVLNGMPFRYSSELDSSKIKVISIAGFEKYFRPEESFVLKPKRVLI